MASDWSEGQVSVGGNRIRLLKSGSGDPLLVLHGAGGNTGWRQYAEALAERFTLYLPSHPGYDGSERPSWLETIPDMACFYLWFLQELGLDKVRLMGTSMGGWIAAEMAIMCPQSLERLVLVDAVGIKPAEGEIADIFLATPQEVTGLLFHDPAQVPEWDSLYGRTPTIEEKEIREANREMSARLCWKPYMHDPRLPGLLKRVNVPSLIVWGREDRLVPLNCGQLYQQAISGSTLRVIDNCGHAPQLEKPVEFVQIAIDFLT